MDQKFIADALRVNDKSFGAVRPQADDLTNDSIARNPDRRETAFAVKAGGRCERLRRARGY
jgi:hypothetical protein